MKLPSDDRLALRALLEQLADEDSEWWPFAFLRPEPHEDFSTWRCAALAVLYAAPATLLAFVAGALLGEQIQGLLLVFFPLAVSALAYALLRTFVVSFWNPRAAKLRPLHERRTQWQRSLSD